ncbi:retrovirus-related pol polyprotein from transposon TNT 1-94 [Tanacetum coccineum]
MNQVLSENERLLAQAIDKDIVKTVVNLSVNASGETVTECQKCLELETELVKKKDFVDKETYDKLCKCFTTLEKHCITLEADSQLNQEIFQQENSVLNQNALSFTQLFELSELKAQSQAKDTVIVKLKEQIKSLKGNVEDSSVKMDMDEIETLNIELEHRVTKLVTENEHLKQTYKQLYDSIKPKREQGLVIAALKNELRKLKGKALDNKETVTHSVDPNMSKDNMEPITPKLLNKRTAHSSYIKHTQEEALVLRDIVEHVKANYPARATSRVCIWNGAVNVKGSAVVQNLKKQDNSDSICVNSNDCMSSDNLCVSNSMNDVKSRAKSKKHKSKEISWKPTRKGLTTLIKLPFYEETIVLDSESPKPVVKLGLMDPYFGILIPEVPSDQSSSDVIHTILEVLELFSPPPDKAFVISLKWIYKVKLDELGGILKNKARLVALVLSPRIEHVIYQMDVKTAFLNGNLREEVYVSQPDGFVTRTNLTMYTSLRKASLGLKQAPRAWYDMLSSFLISNDFSKGSVDPTLFIRREGNDLILGLPPIVENPNMDEDKEGNSVDPSHYRGIIVTLHYLTTIRPDRQFAICMCARDQARLPKSILNAVKKDLSSISKREPYNRGSLRRLKGRKGAAYPVRKMNTLPLPVVVLKSFGVRSQLTTMLLGFNKIPMNWDNQSANCLYAATMFKHSRFKAYRTSGFTTSRSM